MTPMLNPITDLADHHAFGCHDPSCKFHARKDFVVSGSFGEPGPDGKLVHLPVRFRRSDAGRSLSRRPKQRNDCTVRAIAAVAGVSYDEAYGYIGSRWP